MKNNNIKQTIRWFIRAFGTSIILSIYLLYMYRKYDISSLDMIITFLFMTLLILVMDWFLSKTGNYIRGEIGELEVEKVLRNISKKNQQIICFRDVILDDTIPWNIDFVVLCQSGIFAIEVKNFDGKISADGDNWTRTFLKNKTPLKSFSKQAKYNAIQLNQYLKSKLPSEGIGNVNAIVVLVNKFDHKNIKNQDRCKVVAPEELEDILKTGKQISETTLSLLQGELEKLGNKI